MVVIALSPSAPYAIFQLYGRTGKIEASNPRGCRVGRHLSVAAASITAPCPAQRWTENCCSWNHRDQVLLHACHALKWKSPLRTFLIDVGPLLGSRIIE